MVKEKKIVAPKLILFQFLRTAGVAIKDNEDHLVHSEMKGD